MVELEILATFTDQTGSLSAAEIAVSSGVPRSTVFRTLRRLAEHGFLHQDPATRRYILGPRVAQLGLAARRQLATRYPVVEPILALAHATSETVSFSLAEVPWRVCAYSIEAPSDLRQVVKVGDRYPLHLGAGRAILAFLPTSAIRAVLEFHGVAVSDVASSMAELAEIRAKGVAISDGHRVPGACGVAAPVYAAEAVEGVLALSGPADRLGPLVAEYTPLVLQAAQSISDSLDHVLTATNS